MLKDPDFTQSMYLLLEEKLGRKMTEEENRRFYFQCSGMRKEWFYNQLNKFSSIEEVEDLLSRIHLTTFRTKPKEFVSDIPFYKKIYRAIFGS